MPERKNWSDDRVEQIMGNLLRWGVLAAAAVVLIGAVLYLIRYGDQPYGSGLADYRQFHAEPPELCRPSGIVHAAFTGRSRGFIQLGLLLLIATPVARVIFSVLAFARQRDWVYVFVTLFVLAVLSYSLFFEHG